MPKRAYLCRIVHDATDVHVPGGLGWSLSCHGDVIARGGSYEIHANWSVSPRDVGGIGYNGLAVIDVVDDSGLQDVVRIPLSISSKRDLLKKLRVMPVSLLPTAWQSRLVNAGADVSGTVANALRDLID